LLGGENGGESRRHYSSTEKKETVGEFSTSISFQEKKGRWDGERGLLPLAERKRGKNDCRVHFMGGRERRGEGESLTYQGRLNHLVTCLEGKKRKRKRKGSCSGRREKEEFILTNLSMPQGRDRKGRGIDFVRIQIKRKGSYKIPSGKRRKREGPFHLSSFISMVIKEGGSCNKKSAIGKGEGVLSFSKERGAGISLFLEEKERAWRGGTYVILLDRGGGGGVNFLSREKTWN